MNTIEYDEPKDGRVTARIVPPPPPGNIYEQRSVISEEDRGRYGPDYILEIRERAKRIIGMLTLSELKKIFDITVINPKTFYEDMGNTRPSPEEIKHIYELHNQHVLEIKVRLELTEQPYTGPNYIRCYKNGTLKK